MRQREVLSPLRDAQKLPEQWQEKIVLGAQELGLSGC